VRAPVAGVSVPYFTKNRLVSSHRPPILGNILRNAGRVKRGRTARHASSNLHVIAAGPVGRQLSRKTRGRVRGSSAYLARDRTRLISSYFRTPPLVTRAIKARVFFGDRIRDGARSATRTALRGQEVPISRLMAFSIGSSNGAFECRAITASLRSDK